MKKVIILLAAISSLYMSSCQKNAIEPTLNTKKLGASHGVLLKPAPQIKLDTSLNHTLGSLKLQLSQTAVAGNTDDIIIAFDPSSSASYVRGEDAPKFQGFGSLSLSSFSSDNVPLAIGVMPLSYKGAIINLDVEAKTTGTYSLNMTSINTIPAAFHIWLKDNLKKDSVDLRQTSSYAFNIATTDATTFGTSRFQLNVSQQ